MLLDDQCRPAGVAPKLASHNAHTPLHLAFSCYLLNPAGKLLITKRAASKKVWPGVWSNSVCGHPLPGESLPAAIFRRVLFEIGISDITKMREVLPGYRYQSPLYNGVRENELCPVYAAVTAQTPKLNKDEVSDCRWVSWPQLRYEVSKKPDNFSYWLKDQLPLLTDKFS